MIKDSEQTMLPYQRTTVDLFANMLPSNTSNILEVGSDIAGEVVTALAKRTRVRVIGVNPAPDFPKSGKSRPQGKHFFFVRGDGFSLPFPDEFFDAILSVATMEHVNGIDVFLAEAQRVLKPKGIFYTSFGPIWSSSVGHHVCAIVGSKEARFWKPGKNPIPDYAHLLMTPEEMRTYLGSGPCSEELIEPIIQWVYYGDAINRCHFEEYVEAFQKSSLEIQSIRLTNGGSPDAETRANLYSKYGANRNLTCSSISAVFRKLPQTKNIDSFVFKCSVRQKKRFNDFRFKWSARLARRFPEILWLIWRLVESLRRLKRHV